MCTIRNIRLLNVIFSFLKAVFALYIFGAGVTLSQDVLIHQAFGPEFATMGGGLAVIALMTGFIIPIHMFAVKRHNRYLLLIAFLTDTLVMSLLFHVGVDIGTYTVPTFPLDFKLDCNLNVPVESTIEECTPYYTDARTAGFRLAWTNLYAGRNNTDAFQVLSQLEGRTCCGFFAPKNCIDNTDKYPSGRPFTGVYCVSLWCVNMFYCGVLMWCRNP